MCLEFLNKYRNVGLMILRVGIGIMFMYHGYGKLFGGPEVWDKIGGAMGNLGVHFASTFFGFMAAFSEFGGGLCLILGFCFRLASSFMLFTMIVATTMHLSQGDSLQTASHAIESGILFLSLIFIGPGPNSLDEKFKK